MLQERNKLKYNENLISEELFGKIEKFAYKKDKLGALRSEYNLNKEQFHEALKIRFRIVYNSYPNQIRPSSKLKETAKKYYPWWCGDFGIIPDSDFPDWKIPQQ